MSTKTISTYVAGLYVLQPMYGELDVTATGTLGGGVYSGHFVTVSNAGTINSNNGGSYALCVSLKQAGVVINRQGGLIAGSTDIRGEGAITLENYGTIVATGGRCVTGMAGGAIVNGGYAALGATIAGGDIVFYNATGLVTNFGTIDAFIYLGEGGVVTNGAALDTTALMDGPGGVYIHGAAGTIGNFGTIEAVGPGANGVNLGAGGRVTNGSAGDEAAILEGATGVLMGAGTVTNFGLIRGVGTAAGACGVALDAGGNLVNGTSLDTGARIEGYTAVQVTTAGGTVTNFGTITGEGVGSGHYGVVLKAGGTVINGGGNDRKALIEGADGVGVFGGASTSIKNFGTIVATGAAGVGVFMSQGALANGSLNNGVALIEGYDTGARLLGAGVSTNFGTIAGYGDAGGFGVELGGAQSLVNGAAGHQGALVAGFEGLYASGSADTVTNFGTIAGAGGTALSFTSASDTLVVKAGCAFTGQVLGGGGTLDLDTGTGTISGLFSSGGVTVSGSMAPTLFQDFSEVAIGAAANFGSSGTVTLASGQTVNDAGILNLGSSSTTVVSAGLIETTGSGSLTIKGPLTNTGVIEADGGTLIVKGAVTGKGSANIGGGVLDLASSFTENVTFTGKAGTLELAQSQTYTGTVTGFTKSGGTFLDLLDIAFGGGTTASYSGTKKSGTLTVTDGTHTALIALKGNYLSSTFVLADDGHGGTLVHDPAARTPVSPAAGFVAAMAGLGGGGGGPVHAAAEAWRSPPTMLGRPRAVLA